MQSPEVFQVYARYNQWMNRRLIELIRPLDAELRRRDMGAFFGSVEGTLNHILLADRIWMLRLTGDRERYGSRDANGEPIPITGLNTVLYPDFEQFAAERARTDADLQAYAAQLDAAQLDATLSYANSSGGTYEHPRWWALLHMFNHQTHHRGQLTTILLQLGHNPGVTDMAAMLRESLS